MPPPRHRVAVCIQGGQTVVMCTVPNTEGDETSYKVVPLVLLPTGRFGPHLDTKKNGYPETLGQAYRKYGPFDSTEEYPTLFGAMLLDRTYLLVCTEMELAAQLPFGKEIMRVTGTKWVPLQNPGVAPPRLTLKDEERIKAVSDRNLAIGYHFSDDCNVKVPFPMTEGTGDWFECDFGKHLRLPFAWADAEAACSVLVRGFVSSFVLPCVGHVPPVNVILHGRQSHINPGPRYHSRGLNGREGVGNDHVYEMVIWQYVDSSQKAVKFGKHTFLRGTIPLNWRSEVKTSVGEAEVILGGPTEVLNGSSEYLLRTLRRLEAVFESDGGVFPPSSSSESPTPKEEPEPEKAAGGDEKDDREESSSSASPAAETKTSGCVGPISLRCITLLRNKNNAGEEALSRYFADAVREAAPTCRSQTHNAELDLVQLDWLSSVKELGTEAAVEMLWQHGVAFLSEFAAPKSPNGEKSPAVQPTASIGTVKKNGSTSWSATQRRFVRINCADSLDRTNVGCFFTVVQVALDILKHLDIASNAFLDDGLTFAVSDSGVDSALFDADAALRPNASKLRPPFMKTIAELETGRFPKPLLRALAEMFVHNGDCVAMLYTNSGALHTSILRNYVPGMKPASANAILSVQRRFENIFEDKRKFRSVECVLGRNLHFHFPSLFIQQAFCVAPIAQDEWSSCLILREVPRATTPNDIAASLTELWDEVIVLASRQKAELGGGAEVTVDSSALGIQVYESLNDPERTDKISASDSLVFDMVSDCIGADPEEGLSPRGRGGTSPQTPSTTPAMSPLSAEATDTVLEGGFDFAGDTNKTVVVQFDPDTCKIFDVVGQFMRLGSVPVLAVIEGETGKAPVEVDRYSYDVRDSAPGNAGEKFAKAVRSGIRGAVKNIVRRF